VRIKGEREGLS